MSEKSTLVRVHPRFKKVLRDSGMPFSEASRQIADKVVVNNDIFTIPKKRPGRKKGTVLDLLPILVTLLTVGIIVIVGFAMFQQMRTSGNFNDSAPAVAGMDQLAIEFVVWDNLFIAILIGFSLSAIISASRLRTHPGFFIISMILLGIILIIAGTVSNVFQEAGETDALSLTQDVFPKMFFIWENIVLYLAVMGFIIIIALYSTRGIEI